MNDLQYLQKMLDEANKMANTCDTSIIRSALKIGKISNDCLRRGTITYDDYHKSADVISKSIIQFENNCQCK